VDHFSNTVKLCHNVGFDIAGIDDRERNLESLERLGCQNEIGTLSSPPSPSIIDEYLLERIEHAC